jgi:hypothetical protein
MRFSSAAIAERAQVKAFVGKMPAIPVLLEFSSIYYKMPP